MSTNGPRESRPWAQAPCGQRQHAFNHDMLGLAAIGPPLPKGVARKIDPHDAGAKLSGDVRAGTVGDPLEGDVVVLAVW